MKYQYYIDNENYMWRCSKNPTIIECYITRQNKWTILDKTLSWDDVVKYYRPKEITEEEAFLEMV